MFASLRPDGVFKTVYDIDFATLRQRGVQNLLFDLDNTLLPWNDTNVTGELAALFANLHDLGFTMAIISNNGPARIAPVAQALGVEFLPNAGKPGKKAAANGLALLQATAQNTAWVGDQLMTDVVCAKKEKISCLLVSPIAKVEFLGTKFNRALERVLLFCMGIKRP